MKVNRVWRKPAAPAISVSQKAIPRSGECGFCKATRNAVKRAGAQIFGIGKKR